MVSHLFLFQFKSINALKIDQPQEWCVNVNVKQKKEPSTKQTYPFLRFKSYITTSQSDRRLEPPGWQQKFPRQSHNPSIGGHFVLAFQTEVHD